VVEKPIYNVHTHAWDQELHIDPATRAEADRSRGRPMDLTVNFETFMEEEAAHFAKTFVFGAKAKRTGYWVPDEYIANFVGRAPNKLVGFAACDPTQAGALAELRKGIEELGLQGVKMMPMYAGFDPRDERCQPIYAYCQERGLPILFHSGTTFNQMAPLGVLAPGFGTRWGCAIPNCA
jgi:predicted TIM-barrel fold metal-dependent hydrolase